MSERPLPEQGEGYKLSFHAARVDFRPSWRRPIDRLRWWRWERRIEREWKATPPDVRAANEAMQRRVDRAIFFGDDAL